MQEESKAIIAILNESLEAIREGKAPLAADLISTLEHHPGVDAECLQLVKNFKQLAEDKVLEKEFIDALADGNLDYQAPRGLQFIAHFKQLQSNLRHLTWQTQQIARGDYNQRVSFMGDFSEAFNQMTDALHEKKRLEDQLRELYAARDKFMSIISHDLKSPFNGILGLSEILLKEYATFGDQERIEVIEHIRESAQTAYKLLESLLEWSRSQTGKMEFRPELINLSQLVGETILLLRSTALKKEISILNNVPPDAYCYADPNAVLTVIRNLLSNALKFTFAGGKVTITCDCTGDFIELVVSDTGIGIKQGDLEKLFRMDGQVKHPGTANEKGTGLGLLLCKEFIEKNGGRLHATSEYGKGSRFVISLPVREPNNTTNIH